MKYKHIKVDMDYCADPLWVSEGGLSFSNGSLTEFESVLSPELLQGLLVYQNLWEEAMWSKYISPTDDKQLDWVGKQLVWDLLHELRYELAGKLKQELPDVRVYLSEYSETQAPRWYLVEIGTNDITGIRTTLV